MVRSLIQARQQDSDQKQRHIDVLLPKPGKEDSSERKSSRMAWGEDFHKEE